MVASRLIINGIVKNGIVIPEGDTKLPEGAHVEIRFTPMEIPVELQEEFDAWDKVGDEAWAMIDEWEKEDNK